MCNGVYMEYRVEKNVGWKMISVGYSFLSGIIT